MQNRLNRTAAILASAVLALAFSGAATADDASKNAKREAKSEAKQKMSAADAEYKSAKARCDGMKGNEKDVCNKEAKATHKKAQADAKADRKTTNARAEAREDKREANRSVAKEKCDSLSGDAKDRCQREAKAGNRS
jgi:hypothetical protein